MSKTMTESKNEMISPTVKKVLDAYIDVLHADKEIDNKNADRLDVLLRKGKIPKPEEFDIALFAPTDGDRS